MLLEHSIRGMFDSPEKKSLKTTHMIPMIISVITIMILAFLNAVSL
jgi:hypothetical protein